MRHALWKKKETEIEKKKIGLLQKGEANEKKS